MQKLSRFFVVALFVVFCMGVSSVAEEITLTTYYPSPEGNYDELRAAKLAVGSATTMPTTDGDLEASGTVTADTVQANTVFNINGTDGETIATFQVVTDVKGAPGDKVQIKTRDITVEGGIITEVTAESDWGLLV